MTKDDWDYFKKTVAPLSERKKNFFKKKLSEEKIDSNLPIESQILDQIEIKVAEGKGELEKNTLRRIQRGKIKISNSLDLHGYTVEQSKKLILKFISDNYESQNRLLLIISGKGKRLSVSDGWRGIGKIKSNVPLWLNSQALYKKILWFDNAPPNKGGEGAFLVYLKKFTK